MKQVGISHFTDYRSSCLKNEELKRQANTQNPYVYRMFLQKKSLCLMNQNYADAFKKNDLECSCAQCKGTCKVCNKQNVILNPPKKR